MNNLPSAQPCQGFCSRCGMPWHPPALCWAYQWLDVETIERIAAKIYNRPFDEMMLEREQHYGFGERESAAQSIERMLDSQNQ